MTSACEARTCLWDLSLRYACKVCLHILTQIPSWQLPTYRKAPGPETRTKGRRLEPSCQAGTESHVMLQGQANNTTIQCTFPCTVLQAGAAVVAVQTLPRTWADCLDYVLERRDTTALAFDRHHPQRHLPLAAAAPVPATIVSFLSIGDAA